MKAKRGEDRTSVKGEGGQRAGGVRMGCGAGFANDRVGPACDLAERGALDFLIFEGLAERTLAQSQLAKVNNPAAGFNPTLMGRLRTTLPACRAAGTRIVTNMGAANPCAAAAAARDLARQLGLSGLRIAFVEGDDVLHLLEPAMAMMEDGRPLGDMGRPAISANAYLGADAIVDALDQGADLVITGRVADPSLLLAPLIHQFGWARDDWSRLGQGTVVGHLLECSCQVTGGYFADPGRKDVPDLANIGYPIAEVDADGAAVITKLPDTGGLVSRETVLEQLLYEIADPAAYLTPDVTADFSAVTIEEVGRDRVAVAGGNGRMRPEALKATIGFDGGYLAEAEIGYAGRGAAARARLAGELLRERMASAHGCTVPLRIDLIGVASLHATATASPVSFDPEQARDVRLRAALHTRDEQVAAALVQEIEAMWLAGPAGGGGARGRVVPSITTRSVLIDRTRITPSVEMLVA
jgi:Acyclic terpene utilisation family protein AtuA